MFLIAVIVAALSLFCPNVMLWFDLLLMTVFLVLWFKYAMTYKDRVTFGLYSLIFSVGAGLTELANYF